MYSIKGVKMITKMGNIKIKIKYNKMFKGEFNVL